MKVGRYLYNKLTSTSAVTALVGTRIYPVFMPQNAAYPCIVYMVDNKPLDPSKTSAGNHDTAVVTLYIWKEAREGQELLTWSCLATVWAAVNAGNTGNAEQVEGDQLVATSRLVFTIRYRAGLNKKMRVKYRDNLYNILTIHDDGRDAYMHLTCQIQE